MVKKKIRFTKKQITCLEAWIIGTINEMPTIKNSVGGFMDSPEIDTIDLSVEEVVGRLKLWFEKLRTWN